MGNIGSIITKKNGMFISADNDGNIREAGVGNPITECSFIAAPNSIINSINGTYYTPLSTYINDIIEYYIRPIYDKIDPDPKMSIDNTNIGNENQLKFNIINYNDEITLNIINIIGNIKYSDIKWYIKHIKETDNIYDIINKTDNDNNLTLPCRLKYTEGYTNEVIYNKQYFDDIILVYAKASIEKLNGDEVDCFAHVLLRCDTNSEFSENGVYTFHYNETHEIALYTPAPNPPSTDNGGSNEPPTIPPSTGNNSNKSTTPPSKPTLRPHCHYLSYGAYLYPDSHYGTIDLYTRSYPYSYDALTITYNNNLNNIEVYSIINGIQTNIQSGDKVYNNDVTDMIYSYNPNGSGYRQQTVNDNLKNKIYISYCTYSNFKPDTEIDCKFINRIQIDSTWGSKSGNNSYSTYFNIYADKIEDRPENTNGLYISCNYNLDTDIDGDDNTYDIYIPNWTNPENPATIEFTLNKDFGYNYDDEYYYYQTFYIGWGTTLPNSTGWIIYPNFSEYGIGDSYFSTPKINNLYNYTSEYNNTFGTDSKYINNDNQNLYYFQYQQANGNNIISPKIFENENNKVSIDIYNVLNDLKYLPLTILFTSNINVKDNINMNMGGDNNYSDNKNNMYKVLNVNIKINPTSTPVPTTQKPVIDPGIRV